jgi:hypothetical protein
MKDSSDEDSKGDPRTQLNSGSSHHNTIEGVMCDAR